MNRASLRKLRLDRRLAERTNWISKAELDSELEALPDASHKATTLGKDEDEAGQRAASAAGEDPPRSA